MHLTHTRTPACVGHGKKPPHKCCTKAPVAGLTVCVTHGAHAPQNVAAAEKRVAEREAATFLAKYGVAIDTDPIDALLQQIGEAAGNVEFLRSAVQSLNEFATITVFGQQLDIYVKLYNEERDRLTKFCEMAHRAGVSEREVRVREQQATLFADLLRKVLDDPSLGLSDTQRQSARKIAAGHLRLLPAA